jgi:hypothetical protein
MLCRLQFRYLALNASREHCVSAKCGYSNTDARGSGSHPQVQFWFREHWIWYLCFHWFLANNHVSIDISAGNAAGSHYQVMHMPGLKADFRAVNCATLKPSEIRHHIDQVYFARLSFVSHDDSLYTVIGPMQTGMPYQIRL